MENIAIAALSVFFLQCPSLPAHQSVLVQRQGNSNARSLFCLEHVPCDNRIRRLLDGVPTEHFGGQSRVIVEDLDATGDPLPP